jgi:hypothetical protein
MDRMDQQSCEFLPASSISLERGTQFISQISDLKTANLFKRNSQQTRFGCVLTCTSIFAKMATA